MSKIIFIKNNKGGVGKSTISRNISHGLALAGYKVILVSLDSQNDSLIMLGRKYIKGDPGLRSIINGDDSGIIKIRENLDYCPLESDTFSMKLEKKLKECFETLKEKYDYIIVDSSPSKDSNLTKIVSKIADETAVPLELDNVSVEGINRMISEGNFAKIKYLIPNRYERTKIEKTYLKQLKEIATMAEIYLSEPFPKLSIEGELREKGKTIFETKSKRAVPLQKKYIGLIKEVL